MQKKNGLIDSDKVFVTVALWIANIVIFAAALTLPMLPNEVTIFYRPAETNLPEYYSKYNNLLLILLSLIPDTIILVTAFFKRKNKLQNNFISIMMFSIMLSMLMSSVIVFGITEQFDASSSVKSLNFHALAAAALMFVLSLLSALLPMILHSKAYAESLNSADGYKWNVMHMLIKYWNVGAYGFLLTAIVCVFVPEAFCYIPMSVCIVAYVVFILAAGKKENSELRIQNAE